MSQKNSRMRSTSLLGALGARRLAPRPDRAMERKDAIAQRAHDFTPMADIDLMIRNGWGDTPQPKIPADWRTRKKWPHM